MRTIVYFFFFVFYLMSSLQLLILHCVAECIKVTPLSKLVDNTERARLLEEAVYSDASPTDTRNKGLYRQEVLRWIAAHFPATK